MFERALIPLDGSTIAEMALPYGSELAERLGSKLVLYHVCGLEHEPQMNLHKVYLSSMADNIKRTLHLQRSEEKENTVTTKVEPGEPRESICGVIEKNHIDIVIMTAIGSSGLVVGKMIGSVADHICRNVPVPVMLIKPNEKQQGEKKQHLINRILLTIDGSELSQRALPVAEELGARLNVPITLFQMAHIIVPYSEDMAVDDTFSYTLLSDANEQRVKAEMTDLEDQLKGKGLEVNQLIVSGVSAGDEIIDASKKVAADLIVMSTHGRSGLSRWLLGNVAEKVLRHSEVPVLLVNARA
jgi:nucleotide-binding universal stress UspA family protein